jgi:FixJ family two-component response regulator
MTFTVFVVDDDPGVVKALCRLLTHAGYQARPYNTPQRFLAEHDPLAPGCIVLDLSMPELGGMELLERLRRQGVDRPVVFLTGAGDIHASVRAMKAGAVDFLTKPIDVDELLAAVQCAVDEDAASRRARQDRYSLDLKFSKLTAREREVMTYVVAGWLNKQIAMELGTVEQTVKVHRGRVMAKLGVRSVADLVRVTERAGIQPHH